MDSPNYFWDYFVSTGNVDAYLAYKNFGLYNDIELFNLSNPYNPYPGLGPAMAADIGLTDVDWVAANPYLSHDYRQHEG